MLGPGIEPGSPQCKARLLTTTLMTPANWAVHSLLVLKLTYKQKNHVIHGKNILAIHFSNRFPSLQLSINPKVTPRMTFRDSEFRFMFPCFPLCRIPGRKFKLPALLPETSKSLVCLIVISEWCGPVFFGRKTQSSSWRHIGLVVIRKKIMNNNRIITVAPPVAPPVEHSTLCNLKKG